MTTPPPSPRRAKLVLLVIAVAFVGLGVWAWVDKGPLYWWVMTRKVYWESESDHGGVPAGPLRGWTYMIRWSEMGRPVRRTAWYVESGFKASEILLEFSSTELRRPNRDRTTVWNERGLVTHQSSFGPAGDFEGAIAPPWLWGVTDQTAPTIPAWMKDDAKWQAALDAQE